jgi:hypothetical protein
LLPDVSIVPPVSRVFALLPIVSRLSALCTQTPPAM